jgi:hypothetical protein
VLRTPHSKPPEDPKDKKPTFAPDTAPSANADEPTPNSEESGSESEQSLAKKPNSEQQSDNTGAENNKVEPPPVLTRTYTTDYPKAGCQKQLNGTAIYSVIVGTDSKATNLQLIQSAGDPILDQKAQEKINTQPILNRTDKPQEYRVSVGFSGLELVCPKPTPPEASEQTPEGSNSPTPQPTTNPDASSESTSNNSASDNQPTSERNSEESTSNNSASDNQPTSERNSEESTSNNSASDNQPTSEREPTNSGQQSPSETTSESEPKTAQPEESADPQPSPEETPEASNPRDNSVIVPTL